MRDREERLGPGWNLGSTHSAGKRGVHECLCLALPSLPTNVLLPLCPRPTTQVEGQSWYGGGCDLTPFYIIDEDVRDFHTFWKALCDKHDKGVSNQGLTGQLRS